MRWSINGPISRFDCYDHTPPRYALWFLFYGMISPITPKGLDDEIINKLEVLLNSLSQIEREGARVIWGYVDEILGRPSLIRESSRGKYPWSAYFLAA
ncbi:hypothetical protein Syun_019780 [Stephania yunnanensis]|uniref:ATPase family AAA domain-containing protein n=1 Tax=Stephania yunnanensis TaxID=152371 RepID=A0AAP0IWF9_9MAGN